MSKLGGTYLEPELLDSEAFASLSAAASRVFIGFKRRVKVKRQKSAKRRTAYVPVNSSELFYSYEEIRQEWRIASYSTVAGAIDALVERGLIDIVSTGRGKYKAATIYALSDRWQKWHPDPEIRVANGFEQRARNRDPNHPGRRFPQLEKTVVA
ncbi:MAG: hypothetical protein QGI83_02920 [Candidatus Latescibacteria bacterium]|jgi:hypothetical protein|nr:hypothetical protein [Candidatus Latescibacterota bacterium]